LFCFFSNCFQISVYVPGYPIKTHTDNFIYGKPHRIEVIGSGYSHYVGEGDYDEKHPAQLMAVSQYYPNEPRPQYMNLEAIREQAKQEREKPINTNFCLGEETTNFPDQTKPTEKVPGWIKNNAKWWSEGQIGDSDFVGGIQYMIKEKIINIPNLPEQASETAEEKVPDWIRNNAGWWANGLISEDDFVNGIKYLVEKGIILV